MGLGEPIEYNSVLQRQLLAPLSSTREVLYHLLARLVSLPQNVS